MARITRGGNGDEEFEVLDITDRNWIRSLVNDVSKGSVVKQTAVGGAAGWCSGYLFGKVGKAAALALGGSLLVMQVAHHQGYITINWGKLERNMSKAKRKLEKDADRLAPRVLHELQQFVTENVFIAGGFAGGFLLGLAS